MATWHPKPTCCLSLRELADCRRDRDALIAEICRMIDGNILVVETGGRTIDVMRPGMEAARCPNLSCPRAPTVSLQGQEADSAMPVAPLLRARRSDMAVVSRQAGPGRRLLDHTEHEGLEIACGQISRARARRLTDGYEIPTYMEYFHFEPLGFVQARGGERRYVFTYSHRYYYLPGCRVGVIGRAAGFEP